MKLFIFMGISGVGKSTIQHSLPIPFLTNCTTRPLRDGEIAGYHINEVSRNEFQKLIEREYFFEYATYADNYYGTPKKLIDNIFDGQPYHCTKEIKGALELKRKLGNKAVIIYIKAPSIDEVVNRMRRRGDSESDIQRRLNYIIESNELDSEKHADYVIENIDMYQSIIKAHQIVIKELLK